MCGFVAIIGESGAGASEALGRALNAQSHRGPDHQAQQVIADGVLFGHNRLSILDLSDHANQPMTLPDVGVSIVYNGEVFNYVELRAELEGLGHRFTSTGDTEVVLRAFCEWGPACVRRFNGMWAFLIYDARDGSVFGSRDRFGVKPFYFAKSRYGFAASSEIKALLVLDRRLSKPNDAFIVSMVDTRIMDHSRQTCFEFVDQLPPGHNIFLREGEEPVVERYYRVDESLEPSQLSYSEAKDAISELLSDSVRLRLRSDVPVGTCLSGGLDSSSIVAAASRALGEGVLTFSAVYPGTDADEGCYARDVAAMYDTIATWVEPSANDLMRVLPRIVWHQDTPSFGAGLYSQWHVMKAASGKVKVLLDGQGGDEILAGYHRFAVAYTRHLMDLTVRGDITALRRMREQRPDLAAMIGGSPERTALVASLSPSIKRTYRRMRAIRAHHDPALSQSFVGDLLPPAHMDESAIFRRTINPLAGSLVDSIERASIPDLLHYEDRNSMAFSIEARTPFLDYRLVEFALSLPPEYMIRGWRTKAVLSDAMSVHLPSSVVGRRDKLGYPTPFSQWLRGGTMLPVREVLMSPEARQRGVLDSAAVSRCLDEHESGTADHGARIWTCLTLELWYRTFIDADGSAALGVGD